MKSDFDAKMLSEWWDGQWGRKKAWMWCNGTRQQMREIWRDTKTIYELLNVVSSTLLENVSFYCIKSSIELSRLLRLSHFLPNCLHSWMRSVSYFLLLRFVFIFLSVFLFDFAYEPGEHAVQAKQAWNHKSLRAEGQPENWFMAPIM